MPLSLFDGTSMEYQWQLYRVQLINWGTFDGVSEAYFSTDFEGAPVTVVSGASGTGKSTMQDAYDEIMMKAPKFNAASNVGGRGAGTGYSSGKRTLLTYARGMLDSVYDDATDTEIPRVLRDDTRSQWTAIGASFVDGTGSYFTAAKLYYLVPGCDSVDGANTRFVTASELLDLSALAQVADHKFDKRSIGRALPAAVIHDGRSEFLTCVYRSLGIGDENQGQALMDLLARIRSGKDFKTVSALFNELVLERPRTYECADKAIEEFDNHSKVHAQMLKTLEQRRILEPIADRKASYDESIAKVKVCEGVGVAGDPSSPLAQWLAHRRLGVVGEVRADVEAQIAAAQERLEADRLRVLEAEVLVKQLFAQMEEAGAGRASTLEAAIEAAERERVVREQGLGQLRKACAGTGFEIPQDPAAFEALREAAAEFTGGYEALRQEISAESDELAVRQSEVRKESGQVRSDLAYYQEHRGNIPRELSEARDAMAAAAGLDPEQLPFAGELMEVRDGESSWRDAIEVCLHSLSRTILVDQRLYDNLSSRIDSLRLCTRVNFRGVDLSDTAWATGRPGGIACKLALDKESPFAPWLSRTLASDQHDALCVESPSELRGSDLRITRAGQMRKKLKGSHGRAQKDRNVIGFSNEHTIARLTERLVQLSEEDAGLAREKRANEERRSMAEAKGRACERILETSFEAIDLAGAMAEVQRLRAELREFLAGNAQLADLRRRHEQAERQRTDCVKAQGADELELDRLQAEAKTLRAEADSLGTPALELAEEHAAHIEAIAAKKASAYETARDLHRSFGLFVRAVDDENQDARAKAEKRAEGDRRVIEAAFARFQEKWHDPNRGETLESYAEYAAILAEIQHQGIDEQEALWKRRMVGWIREDLVPLRHSFDQAVQEMLDRIDPINGILASLPFGADCGRLRISLRLKEGQRIADFRRALGAFAGNATVDFDVLRFYDDIKGFIDQIRPGSIERDLLLDRRRHVEISAKASWPKELERADSYYNSLAGKSGGEVQELVAFVLGSALLYCLGGDAGSKPVFAPVMLDEGFIKADSEFTARAVSAWKSFGFQLIVATPEDKFQSIAPFAAGCVYITKNARGVSRISQTKLAAKAGGHA